MPRLLLLLPTTTYRTQAFLDAAWRLGVEMTVGSDRAHVLAEHRPTGTLALNFLDPEEAARTVVEFAREQPIDAVVGVDDDTTVLAAVISAALSLPHNSVASASAAKNKHRMRELLDREGVPVPPYALFSIDDDPVALARRVTYPCVVKPLILSASRGVIRADDEAQFVAAFRRLEAILRMPEVATRGDAAWQVLVEAFVPGREVALEGLLSKGDLQVLALFDKPDPLDGPF
ncbi:MAG: ATP-grasp domain-containing protein, partial [candidate division NC10 bacterium]|nr:ATP-grasp domain-containing protein [candidate division NC10 bacterium]